MIRNSFRLFSSLSKAKKHVFLLGPPAVGKSVYGSKMAEDHNYDFIVLGDELKNLASDSNSEIYKDFYSGKLVEDEVAFDTLCRALNKSTNKKGFIIEGFPRTSRQLELYLQKGFPIDLVLNFTLDKEVLEKRILGRITCSNCKASYNYFSFKSKGLDIEVNLPKEKGVCDCCGGEVKPRPDDKQEIAVKKMEEYYNISEAVLKNLILNSMKGDAKAYNVIEYSPIQGIKNYKEFSSKIKLVFESL